VVDVLIGKSGNKRLCVHLDMVLNINGTNGKTQNSCTSCLEGILFELMKLC
jgi:hypothetical protein